MDVFYVGLVFHMYLFETLAAKVLKLNVTATDGSSPPDARAVTASRSGNLGWASCRWDYLRVYLLPPCLCTASGTSVTRSLLLRVDAVSKSAFCLGISGRWNKCSLEVETLEKFLL